MKKKGILLAFTLLVLILVSVNLVLAEDFTKSYNCLREKITERGGYSSLTNEEKAFSLLALSSNESEQLLIKGSIDSSLEEDNCLSGNIATSGSCSLKEIGMVILAKSLTGEDTSEIDSWLLSKANIDSNTEWYLEIDSGVATCDLYSGNNQKGTITLDSNKKISGSLSGCFTPAFGNYWLKIDSSCYSENITVWCNNTFVTSLIYKKSDSSTYYIPNTAHSASAGGKTYEKVNAFCFGTCNDYEGSLWAAMALKQDNQNIEKFKPYLYTTSPNYPALLPSAFLFKISDSGTQTYYKNELLNKRASIGTYWQPSDELSKNYYTSLAVWVLGKDTTDASGARDYLTEQLTTSTSGCIGESIRDTAIALFAVNSVSTYFTPLNITIRNPNQTTVIDSAYPTVNVKIDTKSVANNCTYSIDNGDLQNLTLSSGTIWMGSTNISLSSYFSQHSISVSCKNIADQEKTASKNFNLSVTPMNISIVKPTLGNASVKTQVATVTTEINTESRSCYFSFDSSSTSYTMTETSSHSWSGQGSIPVSAFPDISNHSVIVYCLDTLGNEISRTREFSVNIQEPDPSTNGSSSITFNNPINEAIYDKLSSLQFVNITLNKIATTCVYSLNLGNEVSMTALNETNAVKWSAPLNITSEGNYNLTATCIDEDGNSMQKTISFGFNTTSSLKKNCLAEGYYCLASRANCIDTTKADGNILDYYCSGTKVCCDSDYEITNSETTCYDKGGVVCEDDQECEGTPILSASDTNNCCKGTCTTVTTGKSCSSLSGAECKLSCNSDSEIKKTGYICDSGYDCCIASSNTSTSKIYWWIWLLLILIIIVAVGIVFREKLKEYYYKITGKGKGPAGQGPQGRPPFQPGMPPAGMGMPRRIIPGMNRPGMMPAQSGMPMRPNMPQARPFPKDKELNETLAKLKGMSK